MVGALERSREVGRIVGMARRPFDPAARGWKKVSYRRGDVLDPRAVSSLVEQADVVVHLAFMIMGSANESRAVNLVGSRNVFEATVAAKAKRLVYASSVAAYGFHRDNPQPLTEEVPARGTAAHYYSAQKAEVEELLARTLIGSSTASYVFRPCIVAGPQAPLLIDSLPYTQISERLPGPVLALLEGVPILKPVLPDPGVPFQLVHHDDVASAMRAAVLGRGAPGVYNLAGPGQLTVKAARRGARLVLDPGARAGRGRGGASWSGASASCRRRPSGSRPSASRHHERRQGAARARLAPPTRRAAHPARDDRRDQDGQPHSLGVDGGCTPCRVGYDPVFAEEATDSTPARRSVAVVTDSTPYLPQSLIERWGIEQVSLYVGWNGDLQPESSYHDLDAFYARLHESPQLPTTSQPSVGDFLACYPAAAAGRTRHRLRAHRRRSVRYLRERARSRAKRPAEEQLPGRVHVLDSQTGAGGLGCLVLAAAGVAAQGASLEQVLDSVRGDGRAWTSGSAWTRSSTFAAAGGSARRRRWSARR